MLPRSNNSQFSFSKIQIHLQPNPEVFQSDKSKHLISCAFFKVNVQKQFAEMQLHLHVWHPQATLWVEILWVLLEEENRPRGSKL